MSPHFHAADRMDFDSFIKIHCREAVQLYGERPAQFWHSLLFSAFWIYLALFPVGYGWREILPPVCFLFLLAYWKEDWRNSTLRRLKVWPLFICAALMILVGILFSRDPVASLFHAGTGLNKAFILPFIAMECARNEKDLKALVWALVLACFWEGVDGLWQALHGHDFIMGYTPNAGRLTGSLGDYTVGNYLALAIIPAWSVCYILYEKNNIYITILLMAALFWPALFLFQGASSRSGVLALAGAAALWAYISSPRLNWCILLWPALIFILFMLFQPGRIGVESTVNDNRWDLWRLAWKVFLEHPVFGAGAGQYNPAFQSMGLAPEREVLSISHPHDLYLDLLYAHGLIGFSLGMTFILGFLFWAYAKIRPRLLQKNNLLYWRLCAFFWLAYAGWLINGIFGHDFYRSWWLAEAMIALGIMAGAIVNGSPFAAQDGKMDPPETAPVRRTIPDVNKID